MECGLKACLAAQFKAHTIPDKNFVQQIYKHDLISLVRIAGLEPALKTESSSSPQFSINWAVVKDWTSESRYSETDEATARDFIAAIRHPRYGVMKWVRGKW